MHARHGHTEADEAGSFQFHEEPSGVMESVSRRSCTFCATGDLAMREEVRAARVTANISFHGTAFGRP